MNARSANCRGRSIAAGALLAVLVLAAPAAAAAPGWSTQQLLTSTPAFDPAVAIDPAGNAVATWSDPGWGAVHASLRPAAKSSFGPPQRLSEFGGRFPHVAFDGDGNAVVVWARLVRGDPDHWLVEAARLSREGTFSEPQTISPQLFYLHAEDIQLAVARGGRALIVYTGGPERNGGVKVWGALADPGDSFGQPTALSPKGTSAFLFDAGLGDAGEGAVTWVRAVARGYPISLSDDTYWEGVPVTADGFGATQPTPAINGRSAVSSGGEAIYTWFDSQGYWAASAPPGGWFGEGQLVKPGKDDFYLDYNPVGNFPQNDGSMLLLFWAQDKNLYESTRPAGGLYGEPAALPEAPERQPKETSTGDRDGNVGWFSAQDEEFEEPTNNGGLALFRRKVGQPLGETETLSEPNVNPGYDVALGDGDRAVAIWSHSSPGGPEGTWVSSFPLGPGDAYEYSPGDPFGAAAEPSRRPVTRKRVGLKVSCYVACDVRLSGGVRTGSHERFASLERARLRLTTGGTHRVRLGLSRTAARWVREAVARNQRVRVRVKMRVSDQFGAGRTMRRAFWARS